MQITNTKSIVTETKLNRIMNIPICLAPMVGLSHAAFRDSLRFYMPNAAKTIWPTEMLSSFKLPNQKLNEASFAIRSELDKDLVPQLLGNQKEPIEKSIKIISSWGALGVDINMGCPVKKALKHNYGVSLMGDPTYASEVVSYAVNASELPVSVKFRAGLQNDRDVLKNFALSVQKSGASWVTLHPRTPAQKRRGKADWTQIKYLKELLDIPVIGNGDVQNLHDYNKMINETSCDAVMVGRALTARPWLMAQVSHDYGFKTDFILPKDGFEEGEEFGKHLLRFVDHCFNYYEEADAVKKIRFYLRVSHVWLMFGHDLMKRVINEKSNQEIKEAVSGFFSKPQKMMSETSNRI